MTDDVPTLPGEPPGWPATLRDLLRTASEGTLDRRALREGLSGGSSPDDAAAERRLAFLEAADVFACSWGACTPAGHGREYLDTHDESVLFAALADAADGFEPTVEALAVRPLTDVEVADLLTAELEADVGPDTADRYLAWLRALGYLAREDGVNDLTRAGRRLVATAEGLAPPGADGDARAEYGPPDAAVPSGVTQADGEPDAGRADNDAIERAVEAGRTDADPGSPGDTDLERTLRERYDDTCMVCGDRRRRGPDAGYAEVHYLMPLGDPHGGPDAEENAVVVCPNHRADLEHGMISVDPRTLTVDHEFEPAVSGRTLRTAHDHDIGAQYLAYHNEVVAGP